jgi:hypothetical protein
MKNAVLQVSVVPNSLLFGVLVGGARIVAPPRARGGPQGSLGRVYPPKACEGRWIATVDRPEGPGSTR